MTTNSITTWEAFANATLDHDTATAAPIGRRLAASTPPVVLAKRARHRATHARQAPTPSYRGVHRKPNRKRGAYSLGASVLVAAVLTPPLAAGHSQPDPVFYGVTPQQAAHLAGHK